MYLRLILIVLIIRAYWCINDGSRSNLHVIFISFLVSKQTYIETCNHESTFYRGIFVFSLLLHPKKTSFIYLFIFEIFLDGVPRTPFLNDEWTKVKTLLLQECKVCTLRCVHLFIVIPFAWYVMPLKSTHKSCHAITISFFFFFILLLSFLYVLIC